MGPGCGRVVDGPFEFTRLAPKLVDNCLGGAWARRVWFVSPEGAVGPELWRRWCLHRWRRTGPTVPSGILIPGPGCVARPRGSAAVGLASSRRRAGPGSRRARKRDIDEGITRRLQTSILPGRPARDRSYALLMPRDIGARSAHDASGSF